MLDASCKTPSISENMEKTGNINMRRSGAVIVCSKYTIFDDLRRPKTVPHCSGTIE